MWLHLTRIYGPKNENSFFPTLAAFQGVTAGMKKFIVGKFVDYNIVDSKTVISQTQDLQIILHNIHAQGMSLSDSFQVAAIIEKLPPTWKDFKSYLKHKCKEMNLEELIVRLRIEEENCGSEKKSATSSMGAKANIVEQSSKNKGKCNGEGPT